ncbi:MAG: hypothetical protein HRF40_11030 [Nitrososphaera sp.]|jgi:hypothetical protein
MNKPIIMAIAALAVFSVMATGFPAVYAQYSGSPGGGTATPEQLERCAELGIERANCNDVTILAKERVTSAQSTQYGNNPEGSGTPYFSGLETWGVIGALAAIFGGVAAAFFFKGRGARQASA